MPILSSLLVILYLTVSFTSKEAKALQCSAFYSRETQSRQITPVGRAKGFFDSARQLPGSIKKMIITKIDRDQMSWQQLNEVHDKILKHSAYIWSIGLAAYGVGNLMRSQDIVNWYTNHNSNLTGGVA